MIQMQWVEIRKGEIKSPQSVANSAIPAATCQLHAERASLIGIEPLPARIPASHGGFSGSAVRDCPQKRAFIHGAGLALPEREVFGRGATVTRIVGHETLVRTAQPSYRPGWRL